MGDVGGGSTGDHDLHNRGEQVMCEITEDLEQGYYWVKWEETLSWEISRYWPEDGWELMGADDDIGIEPEEIGPRIPQYEDTL